MALLPCKCPNCGAELEVDKSNEAAVCKYCNTPFIVEKAINNYNIHNNFAGANIVMDDWVSLENLYTLARRALKAENFEDASNYYQDIIKRAPNDWEAVFFLYYCKTAIHGYDDLSSKNNFRTSTKEFSDLIVEVLNLIEKQYTDDIERKNALANFCSYSLNTFNTFLQYYSSLMLDDNDEYNWLMVIGYNLADTLENNNLSDELINDTKVYLWKKSLEIDIDDLSNHYEIKEYREQSKKRISEYINKVKQYDPNYAPPPFLDYIYQVSDRYDNKKVNRKESTPKKGGCYIATCVYGSYDCPEVWTLRRFRDDYLSSMWFGKLFIKFYYLVSPHIVKRFGNNNYFKNTLKPCLDKLVTKLHNNGYRNTPYKDK